MDGAAGEIEEIDLAVVVFAPANNAVSRAGQFFVALQFAGAVAQSPDATRIEIAIKIGAFKLFQALAVINEPAGDAAKRGVIVLDDWLEDRRRPLFSLRPKRMSTFLDRPAVVAALFNLVDHLPQILADFAAPKITRLTVEAVAP